MKFFVYADRLKYFSWQRNFFSFDFVVESRNNKKSYCFKMKLKYLPYLCKNVLKRKYFV